MTVRLQQVLTVQVLPVPQNEYELFIFTALRRRKVHNSGQGAKYTRSRLPVEMVYCESFEDRHEALSREWHLKRMSREEKIALIRGNQTLLQD